MLPYLTINTVSEILCLITAAICLSKDNSLAWRSMVLFLLITCIIELSGIYIKRLNIEDHKHLHRNEWLYNIFMIFQIYFMIYMFYHLLKQYHNNKRWIIFPGTGLLIVLYVYEVCKHGVLEEHILTFTTMSVLFVLYGFYYFYYLHKDENYLQLKTSPAFWWVCGTLFFYFGVTACNLFFDKLMIKITPKHYLTYYIFNVLNVILYSCWSYSFICRKWLRTNLKN